MSTSTPSLLQATRDLLERHRGRWPAVGKHADVSYSWISKLARGEITNPTIQRLQRVHDYLLSLDGPEDAAA